MKTLIIYMSTHGCTKQVVTELAEQLNGEVTIKNLKEDKNPDFQNYDRVIIGGSIHAGQIQRKIREYCGSSSDSLYAACMKAIKPFSNSKMLFPRNCTNMLNQRLF